MAQDSFTSLDVTGHLVIILALIGSFLTDRKQRVVFNGKTSEWKDVLAGVPQGSVLGLVFFLVYINDLCDNLTCEVKLFADNTSLSSVIEKEIVGAEELNRDLEKMRIWAGSGKCNIKQTKQRKSYFPPKELELSILH